MELLSDEELVRLTQAGDASAFNRLAARWEGSLYRFVRRVLGNSEDARDVCQEAFVKAYQNLPRLREGAKFKSWVHHIALNLCRDRFRSVKSRGETVSLDDAPRDVEARPVGERWHADAAAVAGNLQAVLESLLDAIPAEQKTCLLLREAHGFNSQEIADITGVPAATVRTRIFYGLKAVRRAAEARGLTVEDFR